MLVDVPLLHLDRPFTYRVPPALAGQVHLGTRVKVPFGGRRRVDGWVVGRAPDLPPDARDLLRVVAPIPSFGPPELALFRWVADRYSAAVIDTLRLAVPPRVAAVEASLEGLWTAESSDSGDPLGSPSGGPSPGPGQLSASRAAPEQPAPGGPRPGGSGADPLAELVRGGRTGAVYWRPLPGEDRGARVVAL
ncbi:MAG TPA: primosome assembly protein PriA, partial [Actinomycetes bacterium]|nr:primosome assembly protein PriA [Actinomycetes bacterium]